MDMESDKKKFFFQRKTLLAIQNLVKNLWGEEKTYPISKMTVNRLQKKKMSKMIIIRTNLETKKNSS